jgi:hypothetical protein
MSRLEIPLLDRKLWATGDILLRAELAVALKDSAGNWSPETFRVDSGAEMTTMPAYRAKQLGLPMPQKAAPGAIPNQTGHEFRSGYLRAKIVGMDQTEYAFPCFFLGDPNTTPNPNVPPAALPRNLAVVHAPRRARTSRPVSRVGAVAAGLQRQGRALPGVSGDAPGKRLRFRGCVARRLARARRRPRRTCPERRLARTGQRTQCDGAARGAGRGACQAQAAAGNVRQPPSQGSRYSPPRVRGIAPQGSRVRSPWALMRRPSRAKKEKCAVLAPEGRRNKAQGERTREPWENYQSTTDSSSSS